MISSVKIIKLFSCIVTSGNRFVHKINLKPKLMDKPTVYFRLLEGSDQFQVVLPFKDKSSNVEREFNFNRRTTERVDVFLGRVKTNLEKIMSKKRKKKSKSQSPVEVFEVEVELFKNNTPVAPSEICKDVFFTDCSSNLKLQMNGVNYLVSVNCPWVNALALPKSMMAGFPVYASKLELLFSNRNDCLFHWYRTKANNNSNLLLDSVNWENIGSGFSYTPTIEDVGYHLKLKCIPTDGKLQGPSSDTVSENVVEAGPGFCPFQNRHASTSMKLEGKEFRVSSYNILADVYAETPEALNVLFPYCARYALTFDYRKQLILKEIIGYNADILCLQEVDDVAFENDLNPVLSQLGYIGCFAQKGGTVREGVACFYLKDRFTCKNSHTTILADELQKNRCLSDMWEHISKKEALKMRVIDRNTALQVLLLESKDNPGELLVIGNTHLYFHPDADHVRLLQAGIIIKYLTNFISKIAYENPDSHISLIICGDFNSVPECGIYKLITEKHVPQDFIDWKSNKEEAVEGLELSQPWNLESACGTPKYTNFTIGFADCLDYIFYQTDRLAVKQVIPMPSEEELREHNYIPSVVFPSDHIALVADLYWTKNN